MKKLLLLLVVLFPVGAFAAEPKLAQLIEQDTVLVAHIDFAKIDPQGLAQNNKVIPETIAKAAGFPSSTELTAWLESQKTYLTSTLGISEVYVVVNLRVPLPFYVAVPKTDQLKVETLKKVLESVEQTTTECFTIRETTDFVLIFWNNDTHLSELTLNALLPKKPVSRPDITEAFKEVETYPIQLVAAFPDYARKVLKETKPPLPAPFDKVDIAALVSDFRWKAVGIDPSKPELHLVVEMKSEFAAAAIYEQSKTFLDFGFEALLRYAKKPGVHYSTSTLELSLWKHLSEYSTPELLETVKTAILTKPRGTRLVTHWDSKKFSELTSAAGPLLVAITKDFAGNFSADIQRRACRNHLKQILLAFHNYHDVYGILPPTFTVDKNGKPLHSWRVLILPFIEQNAMFKSIRLDEPWDSEHNKQFHNKMPEVFRCPVCQGNEKRDTNYCVVVGKETLGRTDGKGLHFSLLSDGLSNTIGVTERKTPVCWMEPTDILQEDAYLGINKKAEGIGSGHQDGVSVGICDGSVLFLKDSVDLKSLKAMLTIGGGEVVDRSKLP
ncbi:hypothetical protein FACS189443_5910 [Planctomycetales bacterium]|nr:hypothetical protein FACS189443_5910 [Planctomycetales bacterium]